MITKPLSKPIYFFKAVLCLLFIMLSSSAFAEYYMVYSPWPGDPCNYTCESRCYRANYVYIRSKAPYRHNERDSYQSAEYAWVSYP